MTGRFAIGVVLAVLLVGAVLWNAGEMHRENCQHEGRTGCSVLPWQSGHTNGWGSAAGTGGPTVDCILDHTPCP